MEVVQVERQSDGPVIYQQLDKGEGSETSLKSNSQPPTEKKKNKKKNYTPEN